MTSTPPGPQIPSGGVAAPSRVESEAGASANSAQQAKPLGEAATSEELVTSCISQHDSLEVYPVSVRVKRSCPSNNSVPPDRSGTGITGFSSHSRRRLRFAAVNAFPTLVSQFGLTYHDSWPTDGRTSKAHLNTWLTYVRRRLPGVGYLWLLEFQKRNAPHYHVFFTTPPDEAARRDLAAAWCRITSPGDDTALRFHQDQRNWIDWDMGTGAYLCKYLDKEAQKCVPEGYSNFGRFWGNSQKLVPDPTTLPLDDLDHVAEVDQETGEYFGGQSVVIRWLGRLAEKQTGGYSRFRSRAPHGSYTILQGATGFRQIVGYFNSLQQARKVHRERPACRVDSSAPGRRKREALAKAACQGHVLLSSPCGPS